MPGMESSNLTAREYWKQVKARPNRAKFGFGKRPALVNFDVQRAYTDLDAFKTAYQNNPRQIEYINRLAALFRERKLPAVWTRVAYLSSVENAGVWATRTYTVDWLRNIKHGSERAEFDPRAQLERSDVIMHKRVASPFFEANLRSLMIFHDIDTLFITGGSTASCVHAPQND